MTTSSFLPLNLNEQQYFLNSKTWEENYISTWVLLSTYFTIWQRQFCDLLCKTEKTMRQQRIVAHVYGSRIFLSLGSRTMPRNEEMNTTSSFSRLIHHQQNDSVHSWKKEVTSFLIISICDEDAIIIVYEENSNLWKGFF